MFNWRDFFCALIGLTALIFIPFLIGIGFYIVCEIGNAWGFALIAGGVVICCSVAIGFGL